MLRWLTDLPMSYLIAGLIGVILFLIWYAKNMPRWQKQDLEDADYQDWVELQESMPTPYKCGVYHCPNCDGTQWESDYRDGDTPIIFCVGCGYEVADWDHEVTC